MFALHASFEMEVKLAAVVVTMKCVWQASPLSSSQPSPVRSTSSAGRTTRPASASATAVSSSRRGTATRAHDLGASTRPVGDWTYTYQVQHSRSAAAPSQERLGHVAVAVGDALTPRVVHPTLKRGKDRMSVDVAFLHHLQDLKAG